MKHQPFDVIVRISTYDKILRSLKDIDNNGWKRKFKKQFMSIKCGELVLSKNEELGIVEYKKVT